MNAENFTSELIFSIIGEKFSPCFLLVMKVAETSERLTALIIMLVRNPLWLVFFVAAVVVVGGPSDRFREDCHAS